MRIDSRLHSNEQQQHDDDDDEDRTEDYNDDDAEPFLSYRSFASLITRQILLVLLFFFRGVVGAERRMRPWRRMMHRPPYRPLRGVLGRLIGGRIYHQVLAL